MSCTNTSDFQTQTPTMIPTLARVALPEQTPPPSSSQHLHQSFKNLLQEVLQRSNLPLPVYRMVNEGAQHAPKFRSTVCVNGVEITSDKTFWTRKEAEKYVAELGYKSLSDKIVEQVSQEDYPLLEEEKVICKSILHESAVKMKLEVPSYNTTQCEGEVPIFVSSVVFNRSLYNGAPCKSKKEAEQLAARSVVTRLLDDPIMGKVLRDIIYAKRKHMGTLPKATNNQSALTPNTGMGASVLPNNAPVGIGNLPKVAEHNDSVAAADVVGKLPQPSHEIRIEKPESSPRENISLAAADMVGKISPLSHKIKFEKPESSLRENILSGPAQQQLLIEFMPPQISSPVEANHLQSKKRRKNKKSSNKRLCIGST